MLEGIFRDTVRRINVTEDGQEWLTDKQLDEVYREISEQGIKNLLFRRSS